MSFNIEVKLMRDTDTRTDTASIFLPPHIAVTGSFRLASRNELQAFVEAVAKSAMVFGKEIDLVKLQALADEVKHTDHCPICNGILCSGDPCNYKAPGWCHQHAAHRAAEYRARIEKARIEAAEGKA